MIKLQNVTKSFRTDEIETIALNSINLGVEEGEFVAVMGPSGCGKSTLLNILGMIDNVTEGNYFFNGEDVAAYNERKLAGASSSSSSVTATPSNSASHSFGSKSPRRRHSCSPASS